MLLDIKVQHYKNKVHYLFVYAVVTHTISQDIDQHDDEPNYGLVTRITMT